MTILEIILTIILAIIAGFCFGLVAGLNSAEHDEDICEERQEELYCFQCEIEMPVKKSNDRMYCKNCGLRHTNNF